MTVSLSALQEILKRSSAETWLFFVEFTHPSAPAALRFVQGSHVAVTSNGNVYLPTRFDIKLGAQDVDSSSRAQLAISAVDQTLLQTLQALDPSPTINFYCALATSPNTIQFQLTNMMIAYFDLIGLIAIQAELTGTNKLEEAYPGILMDRLNVPGIFTDA